MLLCLCGHASWRKRECEKVGLQKPILHRSFGSKNALLRDILFFEENLSLLIAYMKAVGLLLCFISFFHTRVPVFSGRENLLRKEHNVVPHPPVAKPSPRTARTARTRTLEHLAWLSSGAKVISIRLIFLRLCGQKWTSQSWRFWITLVYILTKGNVITLPIAFS